MLFKNLILLLLIHTTISAYTREEPWGKDVDLIARKPTQQIYHATNLSIVAKAANGIIRFHQNVLTNIDGPRSHFFPSSSQYTLESIQKNGFLKGFIMGCDRLLRENSDPWIYNIVYFEGRLLKWDPSSK